jgi:hypothetical protein
MDTEVPLEYAVEMACKFRYDSHRRGSWHTKPIRIFCRHLKTVSNIPNV